MKRTILSPSFAFATVAITILSVAVAIAADVPHRTKLACGPYLEGVKKTSERFGFKPTIVAGSWGDLPPELRKLPAGAQNCGTVAGMPTIASPAFGKDLEMFYAPLFAQVGCQPFTCEVETMGGAIQTKCKCKAEEVLGMVITDTGNEAYTISLHKRPGRKK